MNTFILADTEGSLVRFNSSDLLSVERVDQSKSDLPSEVRYKLVDSDNQEWYGSDLMVLEANLDSIEEAAIQDIPNLNDLLK